ncbi:B-type lectin plumieribetin-like [Anguilla rostrata]|uniref:B-type lectin plumieribetin-like n=1 Tax=Anguilla rostrata TaxID=7938 RepID=UPI0030CFBC1B
MSRNSLSMNQELRKGDYLISNNREFKAVFQEDGNFVIYGWKPIWSSDTASSEAHRLCMQEDCNFVMYKKNDDPMWHTSSYAPGCNTCHIYLGDDGILVVERDAKVIWSSASSRGRK